MVNDMQSPVSTNKQTGLSLVELMIALTISLFLIGGVIQIYASTRVTYRTNEGLARLQENARFLFDRLQADIDAAGFMGCGDSNDRDANGRIQVYNRLTQNAGDVRYDFLNPVFGADASGPNNSDRLHIRHAIGGSAIKLAKPYHQTDRSLFLDNSSNQFQRLQPWQIMTLADCEKASIFMLTSVKNTGEVEFKPNLPAPSNQQTAGQSNQGDRVGSATLTDLRGDYGLTNGSEASAYLAATTTYELRPGSNATTSLFLNGSEYIEDVTDFQVLYGTRDTNDNYQFAKANSAALTAAGMNAVVNIQVSVTLQAPSVNINGSAMNKTFSQVFQLRNRP